MLEIRPFFLTVGQSLSQAQSKAPGPSAVLESSLSHGRTAQIFSQGIPKSVLLGDFA